MITEEIEARWGTPLTEKTREELIEQIRRLQDRVDALQAGQSAAIDRVAKRCADFRKAARIANRRADEAEASLRAVHKAISPVRDILESNHDRA